MDAKTLEALKASIAKWERNAEAKRPGAYKTGGEDCPLCNLFIDGDCEGCPIFQNVGERYCRKTPYLAASRAWFDWNDNPKIAEFRDRAHAAARDEVDFLKSLLPEATP